MRTSQRQAVLAWAREKMLSSEHPINRRVAGQLVALEHLQKPRGEGTVVQVLRRLALTDLHYGPISGDSLTPGEAAIWPGFAKACRLLREWGDDELPDLYLDENDSVVSDGSNVVDCASCSGGFAETEANAGECEACGGSGETPAGDATWLTCVPASQVRRMLFVELAEYL